jgi:hypothetical protein
MIGAPTIRRPAKRLVWDGVVQQGRRCPASLGRSHYLLAAPWPDATFDRCGQTRPGLSSLRSYAGSPASGMYRRILIAESRRTTLVPVGCESVSALNRTAEYL